ncbi:hypothetical protein KC717_01435 [Candidatus Dojkabacteria bacterium]|uniref:Uncharacterized protein n=1 Tax=Candidatus Dojkabacteria bacterium TaxID=2099670 RepID=A0A955L826_9BACT|nr:hypothetical protein [Candidatus Dojkabacteria bacterium]
MTRSKEDSKYSVFHIFVIAALIILLGSAISTNVYLYEMIQSDRIDNVTDTYSSNLTNDNGAKVSIPKNNPADTLEVTTFGELRFTQDTMEMKAGEEANIGVMWDGDPIVAAELHFLINDYIEVVDFNTGGSIESLGAEAANGNIITLMEDSFTQEVHIGKLTEGPIAPDQQLVVLTLRPYEEAITETVQTEFAFDSANTIIPGITTPAFRSLNVTIVP